MDVFVLYNSGDKQKPDICALQNTASIVDLLSVATIDQAMSCSTIVGAKDCGKKKSDCALYGKEEMETKGENGNVEAHTGLS